MNKVYFLLLFLICFPAKFFAQKILSLTVDGSINPASADFIRRGIKEAHALNAEAILIKLNTPGGLLKSTRVIVSDILASPIPVIVYVTPGGAHAGSAGVFITMSGHIAAMSPGTNIGAAHPVGLQGMPDSTMNEKATNDAAAFIRSIAGKRNRNMQWAEDAVRHSYSITEKEALEKKVIDVVAENTADLVAQLNGREVNLVTGPKKLNLKNAEIQEMEIGWIGKLLDIISDPTIAYILMLLGLYGIMFELYNPGTILPGIIGFISLVLAFYSLHTLPINYAGLALIVFAIILFLLEIKIASHGLLAIGGVISMLLGSLFLIRSDSSLEFVRISRSVIIAAVAASAFFFLFIIGLGLKAQRARPVTGVEGMIGETGEALENIELIGRVRVHGEIWNAKSSNRSINRGERIRVVAMEGMTLIVEAI